MSGQWERSNRLAALVIERGLLTTGFLRGLHALTRAFSEDAEDAAFIFAEWFGDCCVKPAAYKILRDGEGIFGVTIEVYEVENTIEISEGKLAVYGRIADGDGPHCELHILDRYDNEIIVPSIELMPFAYIDMWSPEWKAATLKHIRSRAVAQHHAPVIIDADGAAELRREAALLKRQLTEAKKTRAGMRAAYDAVRELGVKI